MPNIPDLQRYKHLPTYWTNPCIHGLTLMELDANKYTYAEQIHALCRARETAVA